MTNKEWRKDEFAEQKMRELNIKWLESRIPINRIDVEESMFNGARIKALDETVVTDYANAMVQGDILPKLVVGEKAGKYIVLGGLHRVKAAIEIGESSIDSYVVSNVDSEQRHLLCRVLNRGHGLRMTRDEAIDNAVWYVKQYKGTAAKAAELFGVSKSIIQEYIRIDSVKTILAKNAVDPSKITKTNLEYLNALEIEPVLVAAGRVVANSKMKADDVVAMVKEIRASRKSEAGQMAVVAKYESIPSIIAKLPELFGGKKEDHKSNEQVKRRARILLGIKTLTSNLQGIKTLNQLGVEKHNVQQVKDEIKTLISKLGMLAA